MRDFSKDMGTKTNIQKKKFLNIITTVSKITKQNIRHEFDGRIWTLKLKKNIAEKPN